jgi:phage RecT family recombinase
MTSQEVAVREAVEGTIAQLRDPAFEQQIAVLLPETTSAKKFLRVASTAALEKPELAMADRASLIRALLRCAELDLMPNGREAALVTFNDKKTKTNTVTLMPMIEGIRKYAATFGWSIRTDVIRENDDFEDHTAEGYVHHIKPRPGVDRGAVQGAYAFAIHKDGRREALVYSEAEIQEIRKKYARSQNIWNERPDAMREKTCAHRLIKKLPFDPKDRERMVALIDPQDTNGNAATDILYGKTFDPATGEIFEEAPESSEDTEPLVEDADWSDGSAEDVPFEGEEPPEPGTEPEAPSTFTFGAGRYKDKTVADVLALGDEGAQYIKWAVSNWKTGEIVADLKAYAEANPELFS